MPPCIDCRLEPGYDLRVTGIMHAIHCKLHLVLPRGAGAWLVSIDLDGQIKMGHGMEGSHCNANALGNEWMDVPFLYTCCIIHCTLVSFVF